jgi:hypothetical protein
MKEIELNHGFVTLVDDDMFDKLNQQKWYSHRHPNRHTNYAKYYANNRILFMHHFILPRIDGFLTDHIDGNGLNNQRSNLRYATNSQNNANAHKRAKAQSGFKGVSLDKRNIRGIKKWAAQVMRDGKVFWLGYHQTPLEAALAYDQKAKELFGEYARTNF